MWLVLAAGSRTLLFCLLLLRLHILLGQGHTKSERGTHVIVVGEGRRNTDMIGVFRNTR